MQEDSKELKLEQPTDCTERNGADASLPNSEESSSPNPSDDVEAVVEEISEPIEDTSVSLDAATDSEEGELSDTPDVSAAQAVSQTSRAAARGGIVITKKMIGAFVALFVFCVGGAIGLGMWINEIKQDPWRVESGLMDYGDFSSQNASSDQIVIPGYGDILLEADTRDVMLILPNPASNPCYFRFTILLRESGETIYSSGLVPPGKAIQSLKLKRALSEGDYPATILIETFSLDESRTPMNGANVETVLNFR